MAKAKRMSSISTMLTFLKGRACSDTLFCVLNREFGHPMKTEEKAAMPFAGGIVQHGYQCGMIWGATLAAGAEAFRRFGPDPEAEVRATMAGKRILDSFQEQNKEINCSDITDIDINSSVMKQVTYFLLKGGSIGCLRMSARYAPLAYEEITKAFSEEQVPSIPSPVSCASEFAKKAGVSELHATMVAGFAGGIGLNGGGCGVLGAVLWFHTMNRLKDGDGKIEFKGEEDLALIERFLKISGFEIECSEIIGRKFESVEDHASFVEGGGCAKIINAMADNLNGLSD